ncbi:hypothetical protein [Spirillospora sp. CA-294931]|uniref:hypothetical protein n=1 Tax=Spirillospora sp. CA-294931 TaxID=3240042 RepID=UPI003D92105D
MMEERVREALEAEAAVVEPHAHARAENIRRLSAVRRRGRLAVPLVAAVAVAGSVLAAFTLPAPGKDGDRPAASAARLPDDLDPRYRPTGPVVNAPDGVSLWRASGRLCWREPTGGGDCGPGTLEPGRHATVTGLRARPSRIVRGRPVLSSVLYGVADDKVSRVRLVSPGGETVAGTVIDPPGPGPHVWQLGAEFGTLGLRATLSFSAGTAEIARVPVDTPPPAASRSPEAPFPASGMRLAARPRPLTTGIPLFRYRVGGGEATMNVYREGSILGLGTAESTPSSGGADDSFGTVEMLEENPRAQWWYGFLAPEMTRLTARLHDGRTLPAKVVPVGPYRAFAVRVDGLGPDAVPNRVGVLTGYDAEGEVVNTWRI